MANFNTEREGQIEFYNDYLKVVNPDLTLDDILEDNNDGVINGNLLEFKLNISDLNTVLFQIVKYASARRIKGKPLPSNLLLIDLNSKKIYLYKSIDYLKQIEKVYTGGASKSDSGFVGNQPIKILNFNNSTDEFELIKILKENNFTKIHIDENCIVGWANSFYKNKKNMTKADFLGDETGKHIQIGEIRKPTIFKDYLYPYKGKSNAKFNYLMDKLNDEIQKKDLGAFYTPDLYCKKSVELVRKAIKKVPYGNDYIILDRCAGTGNLESALNDEELSHTIVSTIEYYEYKVLLELYGSKVRYIIPPTEKNDTFNMGLVRGADALSKEYINNSVIKKFIDNDKCTVILFENPPYSESTSAEHQRKGEGKKSSSLWKKSFVLQEMKKEIKGPALNDLGNAFIWSAFKYYLRQPTDSYIVYSPVKYWKVQNLVHKKFVDGFAFNRKHFHTNIDACIMVAYWSNFDDYKTDVLSIKGYDIVNNKLDKPIILDVKKIKSFYSSVYYDKRVFESDLPNGILTEGNGLELNHSVKIRVKPKYNKNIIGYLVANSSGFDNPDLATSLACAAKYNGNGFYLRNDNYLEKLPMFCAGRYITYNHEWTERARIMKSADGSVAFENDVKNRKLDNFLNKCLIFTCLEMQNHCRTLVGSDGRKYRNELCLDNTNGDTLAIKQLKKYKLNKDEKELFKAWKNVLASAKKTKKYKKSITYGVYQIYYELNTFHIDKETNEKIYDYPELNGNLKTLKDLIKTYYIKEIVPTLFKYEFLK